MPVVPSDGKTSWSLATCSHFEPWFYRVNREIVNPFLSLKDVAKVDYKTIYKQMH